MKRSLTLVAALTGAMAALAGPAAAQAPGTQYPSQKIVFTDPQSGRTVWRMTTDGSQRSAFQAAAGDQSAESRSFSPDSTRIVFAKSGIAPVKPDGVYVMDLASGVETFVAVATWSATPIFARDGSGEIYYQTRSGTSVVIKAVNPTTFVVRTVVSIPNTQWQEKLEVNADGSLLSAHPRMSDGQYRTVVFTPQGAIHANWTASGPTSDDGALWSPTDPKWLCANRNGQGRFWHVDTLATKAISCVPAHTTWHPNGAWYFDTAYLKNVDSGAHILTGTGMEPIHPNINPAEAALGTGARILANDRNWFAGNTGRPRLYAAPLSEFMPAVVNGSFRIPSRLLAVHYSSMENNSAHVHAHWSFDGQYVLWTTDTKDLRDGTPPGGTGGGLDLFVVPLGSPAPPPPAAPSGLLVSQ